MNTSAIVAIIMGVLMMVLSFVLYPTLNNAMDDLYLYWVPSCELNNERFVRAYTGATSGSDDNTYITDGDTKGLYYGSGNDVTNSGGLCNVDVPTSGIGSVTSTVFYNERGKAIGSPTSVGGDYTVDGANWVAVPSLLDQFGGCP